MGGPLPDGSWTQWDQLGQRGHKGRHCDMGIAVDKKCDVWTILKCEKEKRRRLDLKGRAPARGGRSPWLCMVGASMSRDLSGGVSQEVVQTQDAPENSMRKVRGRAGAGRLQVPAPHPPWPSPSSSVTSLQFMAYVADSGSNHNSTLASSGTRREAPRPNKSKKHPEDGRRTGGQSGYQRDAGQSVRGQVCGREAWPLRQRWWVG